SSPQEMVTNFLLGYETWMRGQAAQISTSFSAIDRLSEVHDKVLEAFPHAALYKSVVGDKGRVCSFNLGRDILLTLSLSLDGSSVKWRVATPSGESRGWIWSGNLEQGIKSALKFI